LLDDLGEDKASCSQPERKLTKDVIFALPLDAQELPEIRVDAHVMVMRLQIYSEQKVAKLAQTRNLPNLLITSPT
jgi:hypothetical protein